MVGGLKPLILTALLLHEIFCKDRTVIVPITVKISLIIKNQNYMKRFIREEMARRDPNHPDYKISIRVR